MRNILSKELRSMVFSPAYFIILAVFLAILNFLFLRGFFLDGIMNFRGFIELSLWFLMIFIPAIAMRSMSEEMKTGTLELLFTKPLTLMQIIGGKYIALLVYFSVYFLAMILLYMTLSTLGSFPGGIFISQFIGSVLLAAAMFAVSLFASSITKNQVFAFLLGVFLNFLLTITGAGMITMAMYPWMTTIIGVVAYLPHIQSFSQGMISLRDVIYFLSVILVALSASYSALLGFQRVGSIRLTEVLSGRTPAVILVALIVNIGMIFFNTSIDTTTAQVNTLSPNSIALLREVEDPIEITMYASDSLPAEFQVLQTTFRDMVNKLSQMSGKITLKETIVDDSGKEKTAQAAGVNPIQIQRMKNDQFASQRAYLGAVISRDNKTEVIPYIGDEKNLEYGLVSRVVKLTRKNAPQVILVTSEDISEDVTKSVKQAVSEINQVAQAVVVKEDTKDIPVKEGAIYLILEGEKAFSEGIRKQLLSIADKHSLVYLSQPFKFDQQAFTLTFAPSDATKELLKQYSLELLKGVAGDARNGNSIRNDMNGVVYLSPYALFPMVQSGLSGGSEKSVVNMIFPGSLTGEGDDILTTTEYGFLREDLATIKPDDLRGLNRNDLKPQVLGKVVTHGTNKFVMIPDLGMLTIVGEDMRDKNAAFLTDLLDNIGGDPRLIGIRGKTIDYKMFTQDVGKNSLIRTINVFVLPLLILFIGLGIAFSRGRRRA